MATWLLPTGLSVCGDRDVTPPGGHRRGPISRVTSTSCDEIGPETGERKLQAYACPSGESVLKLQGPILRSIVPGLSNTCIVAGSTPVETPWMLEVS